MPEQQVDIAALSEMSRDALLDLWHQFHDRDPPRNASRQFLRYYIAYCIQEMEHGGIESGTRQKLHQLAIGGENAGSAARSRTGIRPGTRLIRTWQGRAYEATVTEDGFVFEGKRYRSLSTVARAITGTRWNGWRFFGVDPGQQGSKKSG